jgi:lipid-A-disaccharide synthase
MISNVMMIAAEASSASYAVRLLAEMQKLNPILKAFGVGNLQMQKMGFERIGNSEDMAVMGIVEIAGQYTKLKNIFNNLVAEAEKRRPDLIVIMDYPEFNLMLAKKLKVLGLKVVYYVTPQIWAWRTHRVFKIKKFCDHVITLFPFELDFYKKYQVSAKFFGHPILEEIAPEFLDSKQINWVRTKCGVSDKDFLFGIMPGSRKSELKLNFPVQLEVAKKIVAAFPNVKIMVLVAPTLDTESVKQFLNDIRFPIIVQKDNPSKMISMCDFVLATSGTATLLVALLEKPMVIMYKMKAFTALIARMLITKVKYFGLPNLILQQEVVPEKFQNQASVEELVKICSRYIADSNLRHQMITQLKLIKDKLGQSGASAKVAAHLLEGAQ